MYHSTLVNYALQSIGVLTQILDHFRQNVEHCDFTVLIYKPQNRIGVPVLYSTGKFTTFLFYNPNYKPQNRIGLLAQTH